MPLQSAASAPASSAVKRKTTESTCSVYPHSRGNGHRRLAAAIGRAQRAAWPVPPGRSGAGSVGLPRSSAASATRSRCVHQSRTTRLVLVSKHSDELHNASATVGLALCLAYSLHELLSSGWTGSLNEAGQANNRPKELSSPRPPDPAATQSWPRRAADAWVAGPAVAAHLLTAPASPCGSAARRSSSRQRSRPPRRSPRSGRGSLRLAAGLLRWFAGPAAKSSG